MARRPADASKTYGYLRYEILAALVNGAALFGIAGWVVLEALHRLASPPPVRPGLFLLVAAAGLVVNLVALAILHRAHDHSLNSRGVYLHMVGDALGSVGALAAAAIIRFTGWLPADPLASILLSGLILVGAWRLVRESLEILLEAAPRNVSIRDVRDGMLAVQGVTAVHDLHVWTVGSGMVAMSGHAVVPSLDNHPETLDAIRGTMARMGIRHVTIQVECEGCPPAEPAAAQGRRAGGHGAA